jgi:hypothetical protein
VASNYFIVLSLLCYHWLSFYSFKSYLFCVFFLYFSLIVCFHFFFGLCLLVPSFAMYFWWMGSCPWFFYTRFFFFLNLCKVMIVTINKSHNINYKTKIDLVMEDITSFFLPKNPWLETPNFIIFYPQQLSFVQSLPKIWWWVFMGQVFFKSCKFVYGICEWW